MRACISAKLSPSGKAEPARVALDRRPLRPLHQLLQLTARPLPEVALEEALVDLHLQAAGGRDRRRGLPGALEGRRVHGVDLRELGDPLGRQLGLALAFLGEVEARARPGRCLPVVGVWPWRTRSTSVGGVGFWRGMFGANLPPSRCSQGVLCRVTAVQPL